MRVLCAPDSFKESLTAFRFCELAQEELRPRDIDVTSLPLGDGGEGSRDALLASRKWTPRSCFVASPTRNPVQVTYAVNAAANTAFVEMAAASGLGLVPAANRNPLGLDTFGTGEVIVHAMESGFDRIVVGVGGSATCDGGAGALAALGGRFLDERGDSLSPVPSEMSALTRVDLTNLHGAIAKTALVVASDVTNPLLGENGAARVFGPQKGASHADIPILEAALRKLADAYAEASGIDIAVMPGSGAAGGLAGALAGVCGAEIVSGFHWIASEVDLEQFVTESDWVLTGEGRVDEQTFSGKALSGICEIALRHDKAVAVIAGSVACTDEVLRDAGVRAHYSLRDIAGSESRALSDPETHLRSALRNLAAQLREA